jgi:hypothetical protein
MNGNYLLDTNAIINILKKNDEIKFINPDSIFYLSFITEIELLCYPNIKKDEEDNIKVLLNNLWIFDINKQIKNTTIELKKHHNIKIPDAIICSTALVNKLTLVTDDIQLQKIPKLNSSFLKDIVVVS